MAPKTDGAPSFAGEGEAPDNELPVLIKIVAVLVAAVVAAFFIAPRMHQFAYWTEPMGEADWRALATAGWQPSSLPVPPTAGDGADAVLAGLVRPPTAADAPWVLFLPGNSRTVLRGFQAALDQLRGDADLGLGFWAWRGFDASTGTPGIAALRADARAAWDHLTGPLNVPPSRIHIVSYSLATDPAMALLRDLIAAGTPPASAVFAAAYSSIGVRGPHLLDRFRSSHQYDALSLAKAIGAPAPGAPAQKVPGQKGPGQKIQVPVLLVHGDADDTLPLAGAEELERVLQQKFSVVEFEVLGDAGHADWLGRGEAWQPVRAWILRHHRR